MGPLFNRVKNPTLQEVFDRLYFYYQDGKRLFDLATSGKSNDRQIAIKEAKELRKSISSEYHEMSLVSNEKHYKEFKQPYELYPEFKAAISDMNKFSGAISYETLNSYLYDVFDYASYGLFSCQSRFLNGGVNTKGFFGVSN